MHSNLNPGRIFGIGNDGEFSEMALKIFHFQAEAIPVYKEFIRHLGINPGGINEISKIPFLPVEFFKSHEIIAPGKISKIIFESSLTTGSIPSKHFVADPGLYRRSLQEEFTEFMGG